MIQEVCEKCMTLIPLDGTRCPQGCPEARIIARALTQCSKCDYGYSTGPDGSLQMCPDCKGAGLVWKEIAYVGRS